MSELPCSADIQTRLEPCNNRLRNPSGTYKRVDRSVASRTFLHFRKIRRSHYIPVPVGIAFHLDQTCTNSRNHLLARYTAPSRRRVESNSRPRPLSLCSADRDTQRTMAGLKRAAFQTFAVTTAVLMAGTRIARL